MCIARRGALIRCCAGANYGFELRFYATCAGKRGALRAAQRFLPQAKKNARVSFSPEASFVFLAPFDVRRRRRTSM